jgi:hypothetical protein
VNRKAYLCALNLPVGNVNKQMLAHRVLAENAVDRLPVNPFANNNPNWPTLNGELVPWLNETVAKWEFGEVGIVTVEKPDGLRPGEHKVDLHE